MALNKDEKEQLLAEYSAKVTRAQVMVWANYRGLTVAQVSDLRRQLRPVNSEAVVVKNTLMRIALERAGKPTDHAVMSGPSLVTFIYDDVAGATKALTDFARPNEAVLQLMGGVISNRLMNVEQVRSLTTMPSREVLLARVVGGVQAPLSGFVGTLSAVLRGFATVLNARREQLEGSAS
ncbi:MAG: 50S ribosomal protein L10 [Anaerolineae bacterium]